MKGFVALIGPPGAGKSAQAEIVVKDHGWGHLQLGKILRQSANKSILEPMEKGEIIDDSIIDEVFERAMAKLSNHDYVVLDGTPRDIEQARWLDGYAGRKNTKVILAMHIDTNQAVAVKRIAKRGRIDDHAKTVKHRFEEYNEHTLPVLDFYKSSDRLEHVDGNNPIQNVATQIRAVMTERGLI